MDIHGGRNERKEVRQRERGGKRGNEIKLVTSYHVAMGVSRNLFARHGHSSTRFSYLPPKMRGVRLSIFAAREKPREIAKFLSHIFQLLLLLLVLSLLRPSRPCPPFLTARSTRDLPFRSFACSGGSRPYGYR